MRGKKYIVSAIVVTLVFIVLVFFSFELAKRKADNIINPVKNELQRVSCKLSLFYFRNGQLLDHISGIGWRVAYNTDEYFANDVEIYVSLSGIIEMTNPRDLVERIDRKTNE
jgi:hypothetical protein